MHYGVLILSLLPGVPADFMHNSIVEQDCTGILSND